MLVLLGGAAFAIALLLAGVFGALDAPAGDSGGDGSTLPVTGFEPVLMALAGLALTSVGGVARLRVLGS